MNWENLQNERGINCAIDAYFADKSFYKKEIEFILFKDLNKVHKGKVVNMINDYENWHTIFLVILLESGDTVNVSPLSIAEFKVINNTTEVE
jgi:hypothetical protein